jgi:hypothetical protein
VTRLRAPNIPLSSILFRLDFDLSLTYGRRIDSLAHLELCFIWTTFSDGLKIFVELSLGQVSVELLIQYSLAFFSPHC